MLRLQFDLRTLFALTTVTALVAAVFTFHGLASAAMVAAGLVLIWRALASQRKVIRLLLLIAGTPLVAISLVHYVWEETSCETCCYGIVEERIQCLGFRWVLCRETFPTYMSWTAEDLGAACPHDSLTNYEPWLVRIDAGCGLFLFDCFRGTGCILECDDVAYRNTMRPTVLAVREAHPEVAAEFKHEVIEQGNLDYWCSFSEKYLGFGEEE
jgi:hypothetical protein